MSDLIKPISGKNSFLYASGGQSPFGKGHSSSTTEKEVRYEIKTRFISEKCGNDSTVNPVKSNFTGADSSLCALSETDLGLL